MAKKDILQRLLGELENKYQATKKEEAEALHNAFAEAIGEHKPDIQTLLFVLEMLRFECLSAKFGEIFASGRPPLEIKVE